MCILHGPLHADGVGTQSAHLEAQCGRGGMGGGEMLCAGGRRHVDPVTDRLKLRTHCTVQTLWESVVHVV